MNKPTSKGQLLEAGLLTAMQSLDKQITRELQRSPAELEQHGVLKWEPINTRVERVVGLILDYFEERRVELDSSMVLAQAFTKALGLIVQDLGQDGLGKVRGAYCLDTLERVKTDAERALQLLRDPKLLV